DPHRGLGTAGSEACKQQRRRDQTLEHETSVAVYAGDRAGGRIITSPTGRHRVLAVRMRGGSTCHSSTDTPEGSRYAVGRGVVTVTVSEVMAWVLPSRTCSSLNHGLACATTPVAVAPPVPPPADGVSGPAWPEMALSPLALSAVTT